MEFLVNGQVRSTIVRQLIIAGWAGRDKAAVEHHIAELAAIGVKPPRIVPCFYRVGANLLTCGDEIEVCGSDSSGEAEAVLVIIDGERYIGVGSDHTDRRVESFGVTVSKQMCPKPISKELWPLKEVQDHWDALVLRSWVTCKGERMLYQEGTLDSLHTPWALLGRFDASDEVVESGKAMYCGTLPVLGKLRPGERFEIELEDPMRGRSLSHIYSIRELPYRD